MHVVIDGFAFSLFVTRYSPVITGVPYNCFRGWISVCGCVCVFVQQGERQAEAELSF